MGRRMGERCLPDVGGDPVTGEGVDGMPVAEWGC